MATSQAAQRWAAIIDRQEASGQTIRAFADAHDLNANTLAWWRHKLGRTRRRPPPTDFVELHIETPATDERPALVLELDAWPARLHIEAHTDMDLLRRVMETLA